MQLELGEGRSMAMFLKSASMHYMCKTIGEVEVQVLLRILRAYTQHLAARPHSLLMRFLMLLKIESSSSVGYILCFADIFAGCEHLHERWDIKGRLPKPGKFRHFPRYEKRFSRRPSSVQDIPHSDSGKLLTRKDKDLTRLFWMDGADRENLLLQISEDFEFLSCLGLMDYSILIGVSYADSAPHSPARAMRMKLPMDEQQRGATHEDRLSASLHPFKLTHNSKYHVGVPSYHHHETYFIGIIDMLTEYNMKKRSANFFKKFLWRESTLSTIPPKKYRNRIEKFCRNIFPEIQSK
jgi:hypothetical protein